MRPVPVLVVALLLVAGCGEDAPAGGSATPPSTDLAGTTWDLATVDGASVAVAGASWITFGSDGQVNGSGGCNVVAGPWSADGEALTVGPLAATMRLCAEPALDEQERTFLAALEATTAHRVADDVLHLLDGDVELATLDPVDRSEGITGAWSVVMYNNGAGGVVSLVDGTGIGADFGEDGTVSGTAGCNTYTGAFSVDGEEVAIGPLAVTERACIEPEGVMEQEARFLEALQSAGTWSIGGSTLDLRQPDGALAVVLDRGR